MPINQSNEIETIFLCKSFEKQILNYLAALNARLSVQIIKLNIQCYPIHICMVHFEVQNENRKRCENRMNWRWGVIISPFHHSIDSISKYCINCPPIDRDFIYKIEQNWHNYGHSFWELFKCENDFVSNTMMIIIIMWSWQMVIQNMRNVTVFNEFINFSFLTSLSLSLSKIKHSMLMPCGLMLDAWREIGHRVFDLNLGV